MTDQLTELESFQKLSLPLRRAVTLHLLYNVPPIEAMRLSGRSRNARRDWNQPGIQRVLADYREDAEDYAARVALVKADPAAPAILIPETVRPQNDQNTAHLESTTYKEPYAPESNLSHSNLRDGIPAPPNRPRAAQSTDVPLDRLFDGLNQESVDFWHSQVDDEQAERARLLAVIEEGQARLGTR